MEIIAVPIEEEVKQSYIDYAMSVIVGRAIPDVRDGLKPVQRRILYAMYDMGLYPEKPFVKSARIVGAVLGYYHPHGDQAVYEALVRMAQDFNMNYPLVVGQGNFGSVDGDPPAAMRYTEAKLSRYAIKLLEDIDKNTVDFVPNFDGSTLEPSVLPSRFPNLLCNGTSGIAVGLATSIPPHNLKEVCQALVELAKNPDLTTQEIMKYIKGPDFPTGGIVENYSELIEFYDKGRGQVRIRAKAHIEKLPGGREQIVITELPYQVNKAELIKRMAELAREGKLREISDIRDESDKEGIRIVIELKRDADGSKTLDKLYKHTALRKNFPLNFVVLIKGEPKLVGIKTLLQEFMAHRLEVILRRSKFFLSRAKERLHIVEGLLIALRHLDEVIQDIRSSSDIQEAREKLMNKYKLSQAQANAVLDMKLQRLTSLERGKLEEEEKELKEKIEYYTKLVEKEEERIKVFVEETQELAKSFNAPRRTLVEQIQSQEEGALTVVVYAKGRVLPIEDMEEGEEVVNILDVPFTSGLFMVSDKGRVYWIAGSQALRGSHVSLKEAEEKIVGAFVRSHVEGRILRYNLNMLEMALKELRADIEELNFLAEVCLSKEEELKSYRQVIQKVEKDLFKSIDEVIEYLYDLYEVFNFEITFLANIPEELWREVERLDIPNSINSKMEEIANLLEDILQYERESPKLYAMLTPFRAFLEVIRQALSFNKRLFESNLQRTV